jgi:NAD(P)-dependent dehydrogenase (short-subunit alcohol dehydrogenase family)
MRPLKGRVAIVAGATRGTGRGTARALGEAGATVYCTGRSTTGNPSAYARPETIDETADLVTAAGGTGIAVRVDHGVETEVRELIARVDREHGRLDLLVNAVAGEDPSLGGWGSFWEIDVSRADAAMRQLVVSHLFTARHAAPLMIRARRGLIVEVTGGDMIIGGSGGNMLCEVAKSAQKALAFLLAEELRPHRVAAIAVTPGFLRSETMLEHFGVTEANWRDAGAKDPHFLQSETPLFIGRAIAALAADRKVLARTGDVIASWELAREYGITDHDGRRPDWGAHFRDVVIPSMAWLRGGYERYLAHLERSAARARGYLVVGGLVADAPATGSSQIRRSNSSRSRSRRSSGDASPTP